MGASDEHIMDYLAQLGRQIKARRNEMGLTLAELSDKSRVGLQTLVRIEEGNAGIGLGKLMQVMDVLGSKAPEWLLLSGTSNELPLHPLYVDSDRVQEIVEAAVNAACQELDALFPDAKPEVEGITTNFAGQLEANIKAMLTGLPYAAGTRMRLNKLVYSDRDLGQPIPESEGALGYTVRVLGTPMVLDAYLGRFIPLAMAEDPVFTSPDAAEQGFWQALDKGEHTSGPVRIVPIYPKGDEGYSFNRPQAEEQE